MVQIRVGCSKTEIHNTPDKLIFDLIQDFSYKNKAISYEIYKMKSNRINWIRKLIAKWAMDEVDAKAMYQKALNDLISKERVNLISISESGKYLIIPTGLITRLKNWFSGKVIKFDVIDLRKIPDKTTGYPARGELPVLRYYQKEALDLMLQHHQGTIVAATGAGKSVIIQELVRKLGLKTVILVPSLSIMTQMEDRLVGVFGRGKVGTFAGDSKKIKAITLATSQSIVNSEPGLWSDVDVVLLDEAQHAPASTIEEVMYKYFPNTYYRYGLTATPFRTDGADLAIEAAVFDILYNFPAERAIAEKFLATPLFFMFNIDQNSYQNYHGKLPVFAYKNHLIKNNFVNSLVADQTIKLLANNKQVLILVREKEHGYILSKLIPEAKFVRTADSAYDKKKRKDIPDQIDQDVAVKEFNSGKIRCLIGTSIIGEGTDIVPVDVLINLMGGISKVMVMQNIGRALRPTPTKSSVWIFDYYHNTNSMLLRHSEERVKIYKKLGKVHVVK